ncbi:MAG: molybdenum cofactor synthesis protein [Sulfobacillus acidophilus]|uniref:Molybdopterin molybdenumtransferase n=1 Tax=Sulfobacillus acidophilus TaxID=53633 RepID=A0A2T2WI28_9FIRM|nr:MAG: molybdenum cofactor synthesis protein [Sulfobacillus acidophilus]
MTEYIAVDQALNLVSSHLVPVAQRQSVRLEQSLGRILADPVQAAFDSPPFRRAAMDGYAFRASDSPGVFRVVGTVYAGRVWSRPLRAGEALRVMTGAPIPDELDTVLEQEAVAPQNNITIRNRVPQGRNIMPQGHEYSAHSRVLEPGTRLRPIHIGQLAALGFSRVVVWSIPNVLVLVTGNEVQTSRTSLRPGHIYDANGPLLRALLTQMGAQATVRYIRDNRQALLQTLMAARTQSYRLVITTGGVSVGARDFLPDILQEHFQRLFWRIDMHPGKATAAGLLAPGIPILSLSGNPGAALTAWYLLAAPLVARLTGQTYQLATVRGTLLAPYPKATRETRYLKTRFVAQNGSIGFDLITNQSSDALRSFAEADGLVVVPHGSPPQPQGVTLNAWALPQGFAP